MKAKYLLLIESVYLLAIRQKKGKVKMKVI